VICQKDLALLVISFSQKIYARVMSINSPAFVILTLP